MGRSKVSDGQLVPVTKVHAGLEADADWGHVHAAKKKVLGGVGNRKADQAAELVHHMAAGYCQVEAAAGRVER